MVFVDSDGASPHLVGEHVGTHRAGEDQRVDGGRVPALAEQRLRADQYLQVACAKHVGNHPDDMVPDALLWRDPDVVGIVVETADSNGIFQNLIVGQRFIQSSDNRLRQQDQRTAQYAYGDVPLYRSFQFSPNRHHPHALAGNVVYLDVVCQDDHAQLFFQLGMLQLDNLHDGIQFPDAAGNHSPDFEAFVEHHFLVDHQSQSSGDFKIVDLLRFQRLEPFGFVPEKAIEERRSPLEIEFRQVGWLGVEQFQKSFRNPIPFGVQQGGNGHIERR